MPSNFLLITDSYVIPGHNKKDVVCNSAMSAIMGVIILYAYAYYHSVLECLHVVHFQEMHCADAHYLQIDMSLSALLTTWLFCHKKTSFFVNKYALKKIQYSWVRFQIQELCTVGLITRAEMQSQPYAPTGCVCAEWRWWQKNGERNNYKNHSNSDHADQVWYSSHIVKDLAASKVLLLSTIASYLSLSF